MTDAVTTKSTGRRFERRPDPDAATLADLRHRYDAGDINVRELADEIGLSLATARGRLKEWNWGPAKKKNTRGVGRDTLKTDAPRLRAVIRVKASAHVRKLESRLASPSEGDDIERLARTLASLVKTLAELQRADAMNGSTDDRGADPSDSAGVGPDVARLRSDLVDRLVAAAASAGADDGSNPPDV
jgi:DNA-binding Lrp family transcriptional regulator